MAEATKSIGDEKLVIDVEKKKNKSGFLRAVLFMIGGLGMFGGIVLSITIIGALIGIPMMVMSLPFFYLGLGKRQVACPHCAKKQPVLQTAENFTCAKCRQLTIINWK